MRSPWRTCSGFTLAEVMLVFVIAGMLVVIGYPKLHDVAAAANLRSARVSVAASLATARAAAIRWGRPAQFKRTGSTIAVLADTSGTGVFVSVTPAVALDMLYGVTLTGTQDSILYTGRGTAANVPAAGATYYVTLGSRLDSVCVTHLGQFLHKGCGL